MIGNAAARAMMEPTDARRQAFLERAHKALYEVALDQVLCEVNRAHLLGEESELTRAISARLRAVPLRDSLAVISHIAAGGHNNVKKYLAAPRTRAVEECAVVARAYDRAAEKWLRALGLQVTLGSDVLVKSAVKR